MLGNLGIIAAIALPFILVAGLLFILEKIEGALIRQRLFSRTQSALKQLHFLAAFGFVIGCGLGWMDIPSEVSGLHFFIAPIIIVCCVYVAIPFAAIITDPTIVVALAIAIYHSIKRRL